MGEELVFKDRNVKSSIVQAGYYFLDTGIKVTGRRRELEEAACDHRNMTIQTIFIPINIMETGITVHVEKSIFDHRILLFATK